jgi:hypothetical protein
MPNSAWYHIYKDEIEQKFLVNNDNNGRKEGMRVLYDAHIYADISDSYLFYILN